MQINETTLLGGALGVISAGFTWAFKRQINRIDALEKASTEAQVSRASTAEIIKSMSMNLDRHMVHEEIRMKEMSETMIGMHEKLAILASKEKDNAT